MNKSDYANTVLIVFSIIGSGIAGALIVAGFYALFGTQEPDNYRSKQVRANVKRIL